MQFGYVTETGRTAWGDTDHIDPELKAWLVYSGQMPGAGADPAPPLPTDPNRTIDRSTSAGLRYVNGVLTDEYGNRVDNPRYGDQLPSPSPPQPSPSPPQPSPSPPQASNVTSGSQAPGRIQINFRMPDGSTQPYWAQADELTGNAAPPLQRILASGGLPVDPGTGSVLQQGPTVNGGTLWIDAQGQGVSLAQLWGRQRPWQPPTGSSWPPGSVGRRQMELPTTSISRTRSPGQLQFRMPDGSMQTLVVNRNELSGNAGPDLQAILRAGGRPIDAWGQPMMGTPDVYGGTLWTDSHGNSMPLNVAAGFGWFPGQTEAMTNYHEAGWRPGMPALTNPPPLQSQASSVLGQSTLPSGGISGPGPSDFGFLAQGFNEPFDYPALPLSAIAAPFTDRFDGGNVQFPTYTAKGALPAALRALNVPGEFRSPTAFPSFTPEGTLPGPFQPRQPIAGFTSRTAVPSFTPEGTLPDPFASTRAVSPFVSRAGLPAYTPQTQLPTAFTADRPLSAFVSKTQLPIYTPQGGLPEPFRSPSVIPEFRQATTFPAYTEQGQLPGQFNANPPLPDFQFTEEDLKKDPGYQFRQSETLKALGRQGSAQGFDPMGGRALRDVAQYSSDLASQEFGQAYQRAVLEHNLRTAKTQEEYDRALRQYQLTFERSREQYGRGVQDFQLRYGMSSDQYAREREQYAMSTARNQDEYQRALTEYDRKFFASQEQHQRGAQDVGIQIGLSREAYEREREAYASSVSSNQEEHQRALQEYDRRFQASQEGFQRGVQNIGIQTGLSREAYEREREAYATSVASNQSEHQRALEEYDRRFQASQTQYERGVQNVGIQTGLSREAYEREREAYATSVASNQEEYQRALGAFDRNFQLSQAGFERGAQTYGIQYGAASDRYSRDREAYAMSIARNNEEYQRALGDYDRQFATSQTEYNRGIQDFSLAQVASGEAYQRRMGEFMQDYQIDAANRARLSEEYGKSYGRAFGEYATRFDIDRANKTDIYNRLAGLSGTGMTGAAQLGRLGANYSANTSNTMLDNARSLTDIASWGATAAASGRAGSANAWTQFLQNTGQNLSDIFARQRSNRNQQWA